MCEKNWSSALDQSVFVRNSSFYLVSVLIFKRDQLKSWKSILKENCTYMMHNFKVVKNDGQYRVCVHPYKLVFTGVTILRQTNLGNVPLRIHNFIQFINIIAGDFQRGLLVG